jgi:hypothetical protein
MSRIETELNILVCDPVSASIQRLIAAIMRCKWGDWIGQSVGAESLEAAQQQLELGLINTVFIDPIAFGIEDASRLIFTIRDSMPEVVFVLYCDPHAIEDFGPNFYHGTRKRFRHYYVQPKFIEDTQCPAVLEKNLMMCMSDLKQNASAMRTKLRFELLSGRHQPVEISESIKRFRMRYPVDGPPVGFVMMRFGEGKTHRRLWKTIVDELESLQLIAVRADEFDFHHQLLDNVRTYAHACDFGVAVIERIESENHNPNIAFEVGYMLALGKPVCFLRDETLRTLQTDLIGVLSSQFNVENNKKLRKSIRKWVESQEFYNRMKRLSIEVD